MKKTLSLLLVAILAMSLLVGCGGKADPGKSDVNGGESSATSSDENKKDKKNKKEELVFWVPFGGGDYDHMKRIVDAYNASDADYSVEMISKDWDTYYQGINSSLIANSGPDIFIVHQSNLAEFIPTGKLQDISQIQSDIDWSDYNESQLDGVTFDGVQYSVPLDTHAMVMFYNKDILERAGLTGTDLENVTDMESWNGILEQLLEVISDNEHVLDIANSGANTIQQFWAWYVLNAQAGGAYIGEGEALLNSETGVAAVEILKDWNEKGYLKNGIDDGGSYDIFKSGMAAINFTGVWATGNYETNPDLNFGVKSIPAINGEQKTWGDSHTFAIPSYTDEKRQEAALAFADWANDNGVMWAEAGHMPAKKSVLESAEYQALPYRSDYADAIDLAVYFPSSPVLGPANTAASLKINEAFIGTYSSKEALDLAKKEIDALIK